MMRAIVLGAVSCVCLSVMPGPAAGGGNIAAGRPYRMHPRPNYPHCTDPGDRTQLTDGVYAKGYFWVQKPTVGWTNAAFVTVTIDLGAAAPIGGVSFNTAAGVAGVRWPMAILVLVSDDDKTYHHVGDLATSSVSAAGYAVHRFRTEKLATRGRYVKLMVVGNGAFVFVDEIEVYRGAKELLGRPSGGQRVTDVGRFLRHRQVTVGVRRRLRADLSAVAEAAKAAKLPSAELSAVAKQIDRVKVDAVDELRTVLPLNELHRRIFAVQAAVWRTRFAGPLVVWRKNRWDMLSPTEPPRTGGARLDVAMMRREYRGAAFQISNVSPKTMTCHLRFASLPGGACPNYVRLYEVPFTDTKSGVPVAAAMPEARHDADAWRVDVPAGMTRQVWLTFGPDTPPAGEHRGRLVVQPGDLAVPVRLKVYPLTFPAQPALHLCGWDYTDRDACYNVTPANRAAVIRMLREYYVDAPWAQRSAMPAGAYDRTGKMTRPPDDGAFRTWLGRWPDARRYLVFLSVSSRFAGVEMGSPAFRAALTAWINWWVRRLGQLGVPAEKLGLLLVDEPHSREQDRIIIEYAKVIRAAQPKVVIWQDPTWREPWQATPELFDVCDVLCPNLPMWIAQGKRFADFYAARRRDGRELWFYSCSGPGKLLDPYSYHRMQHWFCWKHGAKGSGFWAFGDSNGASSWNEYLSVRGAYTPLFLDDKTVTRGKHMEAIREGVQDYEYLRMLRDRVAAMEKTSPKHPCLPAARALLAAAADRVTACMTDVGQIHWQRPKDRGVADRVRVEVLDMLVSLPREQ